MSSSSNVLPFPLSPDQLTWEIREPRNLDMAAPLTLERAHQGGGKGALAGKGSGKVVGLQGNDNTV